MGLADFTTLTFDCYGTLIDWETGLLGALDPWRRRTGLAAGDQDLLAAFALAEPEEEAAHPGLLYPRILAGALGRMAARFGVDATSDEARAFGHSVGDWPVFPDSAAALAGLKEHYKLVVLSNVDRASFGRSNEKLGVEFDAVYTAQDIGSYKPDPANFRYLLKHLAADLGVAPGEILHTAQSLYHDHVPARALGLKTCWINRGAGEEGPAGEKGRGGGATITPDVAVAPDFTYPSMAALAAAVAAGRNGGGRNPS